jgi:hypothetical protein
VRGFQEQPLRGQEQEQGQGQGQILLYVLKVWREEARPMVACDIPSTVHRRPSCGAVRDSAPVWAVKAVLAISVCAKANSCKSFAP